MTPEHTGKSKDTNSLHFQALSLRKTKKSLRQLATQAKHIAYPGDLPNENKN